MRTANRHRKSTIVKFKVGDFVMMDIGGTKYQGQVIEDRGNLAVGGDQLVTVKVPWWPDGFVAEIPATKLDRVEPSTN